MALPHGLWTLRVVGRYLAVDGTPAQGYLVLRPPAVCIQSAPEGSPFRLTVKEARLDIDARGYVTGDVLNPNDPSLSPGAATGDPWAYAVCEVIYGGPQVAWFLEVTADYRDGDVLDLTKVPRLGETVVRPGDWFPHHVHDTAVQAGRISPRSSL